MKKIFVTHYSSDKTGGAARAAIRLNSAFRHSLSVNSRMVVAEKLNDDHTVSDLGMGTRCQLEKIIKSAIDTAPKRLFTSLDNIPRSCGYSSRLTAKNINSNSSDIAHLHWINGGFLSIEEIGKIAKPLVWTFHDMWPFCGAEHLSPDIPGARWRNGYEPSPEIPRFDLDRWVWQRKKRNWINNFHIVTPSNWLADCVRQSSLMSRFPVEVIPNTLNIDIYKPIGKEYARKLLNLPLGRKLILFGAIRGTQLAYKGWDLLLPALQQLSKSFPDLDVVIFGESEPSTSHSFNIRIHWMGHLNDDYSLASLYNAADMLIIPSRQESFGQTGSEAQSCGCPVIAFDATGLKDVVHHNFTGYLVKPFDISDLVSAASNLIQNPEIVTKFGLEARERAENLWSYSAVSKQYENLYRSILD